VLVGSSQILNQEGKLRDSDRFSGFISVSIVIRVVTLEKELYKLNLVGCVKQRQMSK